MNGSDVVFVVALVLVVTAVVVVASPSRRAGRSAQGFVPSSEQVRIVAPCFGRRVLIVTDRRAIAARTSFFFRRPIDVLASAPLGDPHLEPTGVLGRMAFDDSAGVFVKVGSRRAVRDGMRDPNGASETPWWPPITVGFVPPEDKESVRARAYELLPIVEMETSRRDLGREWLRFAAWFLGPAAALISIGVAIGVLDPGLFGVLPALLFIALMVLLGRRLDEVLDRRMMVRGPMFVVRTGCDDVVALGAAIERVDVAPVRPGLNTVFQVVQRSDGQSFEMSAGWTAPARLVAFLRSQGIDARVVESRRPSRRTMALRRGMLLPAPEDGGR